MLIYCVQVLRRIFLQELNGLSQTLQKRVDKQENQISELADSFAEFVISSTPRPESKPREPPVNDRGRADSFAASISSATASSDAMQQANNDSLIQRLERSFEGISDELKLSLEEVKTTIRKDIEQISKRLDTPARESSTQQASEMFT